MHYGYNGEPNRHGPYFPGPASQDKGDNQDPMQVNNSTMEGKRNRVGLGEKDISRGYER